MKRYTLIIAMIYASTIVGKTHRNEYENKRSATQEDITFTQLVVVGEYVLGRRPYKQRADSRGRDTQLTIENRTGHAIKGDIEFFVSVHEQSMEKASVRKIDAKASYAFPKDKGVHFILADESLKTRGKRHAGYDVMVSNAGFVEEGFMHTMIFPWGIKPKNPHEYVYVLVENDDDEVSLIPASELKN